MHRLRPSHPTIFACNWQKKGPFAYANSIHTINSFFGNRADAWFFVVLLIFIWAPLLSRLTSSTKYSGKLPEIFYTLFSSTELNIALSDLNIANCHTIELKQTRKCRIRDAFYSSLRHTQIFHVKLANCNTNYNV